MGSRCSVILVDEGDGPELEQAFTPACHRLDVLLVASGRREYAKLPVAIHQDRRAAYARSVDSRNEGLSLCRADPDSLRLVADAIVADEDIVVAVRQRHSRLVSDRDVLGAQALPEGLE